MSDSNLNKSELAEKTNKKKKGQKSKLILFLVGLVILVVFLVVSFKYIVPSEDTGPIYVDSDDNSGYTILENTDPENYKAITTVNRELRILDISKHFYGEDLYWPFILQANDMDKLSDLMNIPAGTIVKIPRIDSILALDDKGVAVAKELGDELLTQIASRKTFVPPKLDMGRPEDLDKW